MTHDDMLNVIGSHDSPSALKLFSLFFHKLPNQVHFENVKGLDLLNEVLADKAKENILLHLHDKKFQGAGFPPEHFERTVVFSSGEIHVADQENLTYLFSEEELFSEVFFLNKAQEYKIGNKKKKPKIQLIVPSEYGPGLKHFDFDSPETNLSLNYNDDLEAFHAGFIHKLNSPKVRGLHFLYGKPGTGKTHYLRHVISQTKKDVIFIPSGMAQILADPTFLQLLIRAKGNVLIIEDAEKAIVSREASYNNAVSTLLNISDGLLSDILNMQIICTFNTDLRNVDKALLRPGRLLSKYEFGPLAPHKAEKLSASLNQHQIFDRPATLAEVYAGHEGEEVSLNTQRGVGF